MTPSVTSAPCPPPGSDPPPAPVWGAPEGSTELVGPGVSVGMVVGVSAGVVLGVSEGVSDGVSDGVAVGLALAELLGDGLGDLLGVLLGDAVGPGPPDELVEYDVPSAESVTMVDCTNSGVPVAPAWL
jgi:hypothetical protein